MVDVHAKSEAAGRGHGVFPLNAVIVPHT